ncbi:MAG: hypothetical protein ABMB14_16260 [Myxococcota bacterium]
MWWIAAAWAAPDGVDPMDLDRWEAGSAAALAGPSGCWELGGRFVTTVVSYAPASRWTRSGRTDHRLVGTFVGRLDGGTWTSIAYSLSPADAPDTPSDIDLPLMPIVGRVAAGALHRTNPAEEGESDFRLDGQDEAFNVLAGLIDAFEPETSTAMAEWREDRGAVELIQDHPVSRSEVATVTTVFPAGGAATSVDAVFPRRMRVGEGLVKVSLFDAQAHLRSQPVGDVVMPALDSLSFGIGALGFTFAYEQVLTYERATRCVGPG